jgi:cellulose synthase/poly-beta-1,6-N-acetylglucosamine synthase-like glycosyltransferase
MENLQRAYIRADLTPKELRLYRFFECVPATLVWLTILGAIALSLWATSLAIIFIIAFDLYWFFRVLYFVVFLSVSWHQHRRALNIDWDAELQKVPGWECVIHVVVLPTVHEPIEVLRHTLEALAHAKYPSQKMIVALEGEERAGPAFVERAQTLQAEFAGQFLALIYTVHPDGLVGEIKAKGANMAWAGPCVLKVVDDLKIPHEDVLVSAFDCDTVVHPQYFAHLTKTFLETPNRLHASYQPAVLYSNNIWSAMPVVRISAFGTTFWLLSELARPERLFTFSSHSMPLQMLIDVGWWQKDIVSEDSRIFMQGFIRYGGDYRVIPMYVPVSMDAIVADSWWGSLVNLYKQQRRWAWGVEHFPYMVMNFLKHHEIPWKKRVGALWLQLEGMYTWATAPTLIFVLGWLPMLVARQTGQNQALIQNAPRTLDVILTLAMIGVFSSAILSLPLLPERPPKRSPWSWIVMFLQWGLLPFTFVIFGAIPAIDAQTRLALGKKFHLGFWVTPKIQK